MRASIPRRRVDGTVTVSVRSSDGAGAYPVVVSGDQVSCGCRGSLYHHGKCRHRASVTGWLEAVIPPRFLPE